MEILGFGFGEEEINEKMEENLWMVVIKESLMCHALWTSA